MLVYNYAKDTSCLLGAKKLILKHGKRLRFLLLWASIGLVVLLFAGVFWGLNRVGEIASLPENGFSDTLTIKALKEDSLGASVDTAFEIISQEPLQEKTVEEYLKIKPAVEYKLKKDDGGRKYKVTPLMQLEANKIYTLSLDPTGKDRECNTWAFQTKKDFGVVGTLPRDSAAFVPVDTGIEIIFTHDSFDLSVMAEYFSISPQVQGHFEQYENTLVFVPQSLNPGTLYTVSIKKGLPLLKSEEELGYDYSFSFETDEKKEDKVKYEFDILDKTAAFAGGEEPVFTAYYVPQNQIPTLNIKVYRYAGYQEYIAALEKSDAVPEWAPVARVKNKEDFTELSKVGEYNTELLTVNDYQHYIVFPEALPLGYYAAEIKVGEASTQVRFQVSNLGVYQVADSEKNILWVNDLVTKAPPSEARARLPVNGKTVKADENGVISINKELLPDGEEDGQNKTATEAVYALVSSSSYEVLARLDNTINEDRQEERLQSKDYWRYLYLDRVLYKPGDMVNYWGVLAVRSEDNREIEEVEVELEGAGRYYHGEAWGNSPIVSETIPLEGNTYTGAIALPQLKPGYYYLTVKADGVTMASRGFSVETYQKPSYQLTVEPEKKAVFAGEATRFKAAAHFFEGTPVPQLSLECRINDETKAVVTDKEGVAEIPYTGKMSSTQSSNYRINYLGVRTALPEYGEITAESGIYVFRSRVYLQAEAEWKADYVVVNAVLSQVDLSRINEGEYPSEENFIAETMPNSTIQGKIYRDVWEKTEQGERYDYLSKKVVKQYLWKHSAEHVDDVIMTTDSKGRATVSIELPQDDSYYIDLTAVDNEGYEFSRRVWLGKGNSNQGYYDAYQYYHLETKQGEEQFAPGEEVGLVFLKNDEQLTERASGYFYFRGGDVAEEYSVSDSPDYTFTFTDMYIPNVNVGGVYFDGRFYHETPTKLVPFARENKALKVEVATDKEEYKPQEEVKLVVRVTDDNDKPVQAKVCLSLVDEALFSLKEQSVDFLSELYTKYIYGNFHTSVSHGYPRELNFAEGGGEGGGERREFKDALLFSTLETDSKGKAATEITLPDNLTSWRITYHALTDDLQAKSGTELLPVRLPFFVEMNINDVYLDGDIPVVILRSFGEGIKAGERVEYKFKLVAPDGKTVERSGSGLSFTSYDWVLPALEKGTYTLTAEAKANGYTDVVTRELKVVDSLLERTVTTFSTAVEGQIIGIPEGVTEPLTVVFSDYERSQYLKGLYKTACQNGNRLEQRLGGYEAMRLLNDYFANEDYFHAASGEVELLQYQQEDGGIAILPYAESEPALSALAASVNAEAFDKKALIGYFYELLEKDEIEDKTPALWGLAVLEEPVLLRINKYLEKEGLSPEEKFRLALASLDAGNGAYASAVYAELQEAYGEKLGETLRMKVGSKQDDIILSTAQMALLAARLDRPEKYGLYQYLLENPADNILISLHEAGILKYLLQYMDPTIASLTYERNGQFEKETLDESRILSLTLLPEDAEEIILNRVVGKVGVLTAYTVPHNAESINPRKGMNIDREYTVGGVATRSFDRSDLVKVMITYSVSEEQPAGDYEIVDILPAGLRYIEGAAAMPRDRACWLKYPSEVKGQKVVFTVREKTGTIEYYARVVSPGGFVAEPPLISHMKYDEICAFGQETRIAIK